MIDEYDAILLGSNILCDKVLFNKVQYSVWQMVKMVEEYTGYFLLGDNILCDR